MAERDLGQILGLDRYSGKVLTAGNLWGARRAKKKNAYPVLRSAMDLKQLRFPILPNS